MLRRNYIHDITSKAAAGGLRFDNDTWFCSMTGNVVWNVNGSSIVSKHVNDIDNNILVNSGVRGVLLLSVGPKWGSNIRRNIVVNRRDLYEPSMNQWAKLDQILVAGVPEECAINQNLWHVPDDPKLERAVLAKLREAGLSKQGRTGDPGFRNEAKGDFRLRPDSPALDMGFVPFDDWGTDGKAGRTKR